MLVDNDSGDEGRIALSHVVLGLLLLADILGVDRQQGAIAVAEGRCRPEGHGGRGSIADGAAAAITAEACLGRVALIRVFLDAGVGVGEGERCRCRPSVEERCGTGLDADNRDPGAGGCGLGVRRERVRIDDWGFGGVRWRRCEVQEKISRVIPAVHMCPAVELAFSEGPSG